MKRQTHIKPVMKKALLLIVGLACLGFSFSYRELTDLRKNLEIFAALYRQITLSYVEPVDGNTLMKKGIDAMLADLDPYTEFVPETEVEDFRLRYVSTQYGGIGARIVRRDNGKLTVAELFEGYPAQQSGLSVGDELLSIDGRSLQGLDAEEVSRQMKGKEGSRVLLGVRSFDTGLEKEISIVREGIVQPNIPYFSKLDGNIGYIKLDKFLTGAADEMRRVILRLQKNGVLQGLILDLRDNGGGILQESVKIVNLFVNEGETVVSQQGQMDGSAYIYKTNHVPLAADLPLVVLINERSASASEIVAGALQDLDRAVIIGDRSFGKGLVQQTFRLPYNNLVKVTTARYYTPSGRCIQALDYTHRDTEGHAIIMNDSLIAEFATKNGRKVYNGNGIFPDIEIHKKGAGELIQAMERKFLFSDYASWYRIKHPKIKKPEEFTLSDSEYQDFLGYLKANRFQYQPASAALLKQLQTTLSQEGHADLFEKTLDDMEVKMGQLKTVDLTHHQDEVKNQLEQEIVSRYYFQQGQYRFSEKKDLAILQAKTVLASQNKLVYQDILAGKGIYGIIGKPKVQLAAIPIEQP